MRDGVRTTSHSNTFVGGFAGSSKVYNGTIQAYTSAATTITLDSSGSAVSNEYQDMFILITSDAGKGRN